MISLALRPLTTDQLPAAVALDKLCFGGFWTLEGYQRELESPNSDLLALTTPARPGAETSFLVGIGCLWAILDEAHITLLAIHPDWRQQGLGRALLWGLLRSAQHRGLERATLEVRVSNQAAIALYQGMGFKQAGQRRHYYSTPEEDALILWQGDLQAPSFSQFLAVQQQTITQQLTEAGWQLTQNPGLEP